MYTCDGMLMLKCMRGPIDLEFKDSDLRGWGVFGFVSARSYYFRCARINIPLLCHIAEYLAYRYSPMWIVLYGVDSRSVFLI